MVLYFVVQNTKVCDKRPTNFFTNDGCIAFEDSIAFEELFKEEALVVCSLKNRTVRTLYSFILTMINADKIHLKNQSFQVSESIG